MVFIVDHVRLKAPVTEFTSKILQVEDVVQTKYECDLHWHIYLTLGLSFWNCILADAGQGQNNETAAKDIYFFS